MAIVGFFVILFFLACAPRIIRYPGPIMGLGREPVAAFRQTVEPQPKKSSHVVPKKGIHLAKAARSFVGKKKLQVGDKTYGYHCSGYISAVFAKAGLSVQGSTKSLYSQSKKKGVLSTKPQVGSIVFFDNTYDANKNGSFDDPLSHIAIVEKIFDDGRVSMLHLGSQGIVPLILNLQQPDQHKDMDGILHNSFLRVRRSKKDKRPRLAGQLWRGFAFWEKP